MSPPEPMSIRPRESAVTAALAGAVVVVLAYASGFGLRTPLVAAPVPQAPTSPEPTVSVPTAVPAPTYGPIVIAGPPAATPQPVASSTPSPRVEPTPGSPTPVPTETPCTPGVVGALLQPVSSLVDGLLGTGLLDVGLGGVGCTVDGLLGSDCCASSQVAVEGKAR